MQRLVLLVWLTHANPGAQSAPPVGFWMHDDFSNLAPLASHNPKTPLASTSASLQAWPEGQPVVEKVSHGW